MLIPLRMSVKDGNLELALERIKKAEQDNFIPVGSRKRRFRSSLKAKASL
jgi:ribosomal protein S21